MIYVNANVDTKSFELLDTAALDDMLSDLYPESNLYVTFVARNLEIESAVWQEQEDTFIRVVLPYETTMQANNLSLLCIELLLAVLQRQEVIITVELEAQLEKLIGEHNPREMKTAV
ncbi:MAG: hypothetical protein AAFN93_07130 [Bacteroidota bacterium]